MKVKDRTAKKPYGICPASMTIWNARPDLQQEGHGEVSDRACGMRQSISICGSTVRERRHEHGGARDHRPRGVLPEWSGAPTAVPAWYDTLNTIKMSKMPRTAAPTA